MIAERIINKNNSIINLPNNFNITIDPLKGEMVIINFYSDSNNLASSYWAVIVNEKWNLISFSGDSSSII